MAHIDWLVDRDGVMFAPNSPGTSEDSGETQARREPGEINESGKDARAPEQIEVGDPRDGP
jgi:hypothetical protein